MTHFHADGSCVSPTCGRGTWTAREVDGDLIVEFSEGNGCNHYVMRVDANGKGTGTNIWVDEQDYTRHGHPVQVILTRRLPMPKGER